MRFLKKRVGDRADHHVVLPARLGPTFEMIEPEFGLEVLIVLLGRPALMRESAQRPQRDPSACSVQRSKWGRCYSYRQRSRQGRFAPLRGGLSAAWT
jgi:hypothetical protein